jgi:hypothetical protein
VCDIFGYEEAEVKMASVEIEVNGYKAGWMVRLLLFSFLDLMLNERCCTPTRWATRLDSPSALWREKPLNTFDFHCWTYSTSPPSTVDQPLPTARPRDLS